MLAGLQDKWRPLRAQLFPTLVLVDLSDQLVIGQPVKKGKAVEPIWTAPIPARTCRDGVPLLVDALGDFLGDLLLENGGVDAQLMVSLPRKAATWRVLEWPLGAEPCDSVELLRERRPDLGLPFDLDDAYLDVQPLAGHGTRAMLVAAPRSVVEAWVEVIAIAGGSLQHLVPAQVCLGWALADRLELAASGSALALLQPLDQQMQLIIWRDGVPEFERALPETTPELIPALQRSLAYYQWQLEAEVPLRLLLAEPMDDLDALQEALGMELGTELELIDRDGFGSLCLQGLATLELAR